MRAVPVAPAQGPTGHFTVEPGFLAFDIWSTKIQFVHGGHRYLIGFIHPESNVRKSYRMRKKTMALDGIKAGMSFGDMEAHMHDVGLVFDRLIAAWFRVRADKVHIGMKEVPFLPERSLQERVLKILPLPLKKGSKLAFFSPAARIFWGGANCARPKF